MTITAELDKKDLLRLVYGVTPYFSLFEHLTEEGYGAYCLNNSNGWEWNKKRIEKMSEEKLYDLYQVSKNSLK